MACQYLSDLKGQPKQTLSRIVAFYIPISKVYRNAPRRKGTYLDPRVLGTIRKRSSELDRTGLLPHLSNQTLKERGFARTDRTGDRNDLPFRNSHVSIRDLEHLLRLMRGRGSGRTRNGTRRGGGGRVRIRVGFLPALLISLRVLRFLFLSFPLPLPFAPSGSRGGASQVNEAPPTSRALSSSKFLVCSSGKDSASNTS